MFGRNLTSTSPFDEVVEKATSEVNTTENWDLILQICDKVKEAGPKGPKECLLSLKKRLNHRDPHVVLHALALLDSCMSNCGRPFHMEVSTREFINELRSKATGSNPTVAEKTRLIIKRWVDEECKNEPALNLITSLYLDLKRDGYEFVSSDPPKSRTESVMSTVVGSQRQEEDDLAKAIQLSLKEQEKGQPARSGGASGLQGNLQTASMQQHLYPAAQPPSSRIVKALYDFEAAEDNELTFKAGEMITVLDDSDVNWWKGSNYRGEGLFPASFVTADLTAPLDAAVVGGAAGSDGIGGKKKSVQFEEVVEVKTLEPPPSEVACIDQEKLDRCLELLQDADPTGGRADPSDLLLLEEQCQAMGPLIDHELECVDHRHNQLAEVNVKLMDALNLYHGAMKDAAAQLQAQFLQQQQQHQYAAQHHPAATGYYQQQQQAPLPSMNVAQQMQHFPQTSLAQFAQHGVQPQGVPQSQPVAADGHAYAAATYGYGQPFTQQANQQPQYVQNTPRSPYGQ